MEKAGVALADLPIPIFDHCRSRLDRLEVLYTRNILKIKWSFGPNSAWGSRGMMTIVKTHPRLLK